MQISAMSPDHRPAASVVADLFKSQTPKELEERLQALYGARGERLNWEEFWRLMDESESKHVILRDHPDLLLGLQSQDCSPPVFKAYVRFIAHTKKGGDYLYTPGKRICGGAIEPGLVFSVLENSWNLQADRSKEALSKIAPELLQFFANEATHEDFAGWKSALTAEKESFFIELFDSTIDAGDFKSAAGFVSAFKKVRGALPFPEFLGMRLLGANEQFWRSLSKNVSVAEAIQLLYEVLSDSFEKTDTLLAQAQNDTVSRVSDALISYSIGLKDETWATTWLRFQKLKQVILTINKTQDIHRRLELLDRAHQSLIRWNSGHNPHTGIAYLSRSLTYAPNTARNLDLAWVAYVLAQSPEERPNNHELDSIRLRLRSLGLAGLGPEDQILLARLQFHLSIDLNEKIRNASTYCKVLEENGVVSNKWTASEFQNHLRAQRNLSAGCHYIDLERVDSSKVISLHNVIGTPDTVLTFLNLKSLEFKVPTLFAGAIVLFPPLMEKGVAKLYLSHVWDHMPIVRPDDLEFNGEPPSKFRFLTDLQVDPAVPGGTNP